MRRERGLRRKKDSVGEEGKGEGAEDGAWQLGKLI